jgi:hypothetical protein
VAFYAGLYYPQEVTLEMGPTSIIARSQFIPDFNAGYQSPDVIEGILPEVESGRCYRVYTNIVICIKTGSGQTQGKHS